MKTYLLTLAFAFTLGSSSALFAQTSGSTNAPSATAPSNNSVDPQRAEKLKAALDKLDVTVAQKQQIQQIIASTQPGKERRQQILAVLTPDQKQKLLAMLKERREQQAAQ